MELSSPGNRLIFSSMIPSRMTPRRFKIVFGVFMLVTLITLVLDQIASREKLLNNLKDQLRGTTHILSEILADDNTVTVRDMQTLIENVRRSPHHMVGVVDTSWNVIVHHPRVDTSRVILPSYQHLLDFAAGDRVEAVMKLSADFDGTVTRWISIRKVRDKPYLVYAAESEAAALPRWHDRLVLYTLLYGLLGAGIVVLYRYQAKLLRSETKIRKLLDDISEIPVQGYTPDGTVLYWNKASETTYGYSSNDLIGKNIYQYIVPEEIEADVKANARKLVSTGVAPDAKLWLLKTKSGEKIHILTHYVLLNEREGPEIFCFDVNLEPMIQARKQVEDLLREKEMLLKEVHHRIKNNMSTISGLLWLQAETLENPDAALALMEAHGRVQNMMVLYDQLYRSAQVDKISLSDYLTDLIGKIRSTTDTASRIDVETDLEDADIDSKKLLAIGMIVNELLGNVYKYAFPDRLSGWARIQTRFEADGTLLAVEIRDSGIGLPASVIANQSGAGFGMTLVAMLNDQLGGHMEILNDPGATFRFRFPI